MLHFATLGFCGVNLHGGGNGIYSPIVGSPSTGFSRRPEFFGIQFAQRFAGTTLLNTSLQCNSDRLTAYAARRSQNTSQTGGPVDLLAVINKTAAPATLNLVGPLAGKQRWHAMQLSGPALDATADITFSPIDFRLDHDSRLTVPAHTALLLTD